MVEETKTEPSTESKEETAASMDALGAFFNRVEDERDAAIAEDVKAANEEVLKIMGNLREKRSVESSEIPDTAAHLYAIDGVPDYRIKSEEERKAIREEIVARVAKYEEQKDLDAKKAQDKPFEDMRNSISEKVAAGATFDEAKREALGEFFRDNFITDSVKQDAWERNLDAYYRRIALAEANAQMKQTLANAADRVRAGMADASGRVKAGVANAADKVNAGVANASTRVRAGMADAADKINAGMADASGRVKAGVANAADKVNAGVTNASTRVRAGMADAADRINAGMADASGRVKAGVANAADKVNAGVANASTRVRAGMADAADKINAGMADASGRVKAGVANAADKVNAGVANASTRVKAGMASVKGSVASAFDKARQGVRDAHSAATKSGKKVLENGVVSKWLSRNKNKLLGVAGLGVSLVAATNAAVGGFGLMAPIMVAGVSSTVFPPYIAVGAAILATKYLLARKENKVKAAPRQVKTGEKSKKPILNTLKQSARN